MAETMTISDAASLEQWRKSVNAVFVPGAVPPAEFALPGLDNRRLTLQVERLRDACGCAAAGFAMAAALIFLIGLHAGSGRALGDVPPLEWASAVGIMVGATVLGKLSALFWAHRQLVRLADSIRPFSAISGANLQAG